MSNQPRFHGNQLIIPRSARGYNPDEFIYFEWHPALSQDKFRVLVNTLSGEWMSMGNLKSKMFVPNVYFDPHAKLVIVGTNEQGEQIRFITTLRRSHMYLLNQSQGGDYEIGSYIKQC